MKIDIFPHIIPLKYKDKLIRTAPFEENFIRSTPMLFDLDVRFQLMDRYDGLKQVLTLARPALEDIAGPAETADLARLANEGLAELVARYPDRFPAAVASLPMNNIAAALREVDRAIGELGFKGVQIFTPINDKPLDSPEFMPLYEKMAEYNLPIWIHPRRDADYADYRTLDKSKYWIHALFGWPYETTAAMAHLVFSGVFDKWPNLKFITHHAGAMVPYFEDRIVRFYEKAKTTLGHKYLQELDKTPIEYFKMFYNDTALSGNTQALMCAYTFAGADHILFGTDIPLGDGQSGFTNTGYAIEAIGRMDIPDADKKKIFEDNARQLLHLTL